jgi:hypothetical protein
VESTWDDRRKRGCVPQKEAVTSDSQTSPKDIIYPEIPQEQLSCIFIHSSSFLLSVNSISTL